MAANTSGTVTGGGGQRLLYRPGEAAEILGLSRSKVYELLASGELASVTIGSVRRISAQALVDFVKERSSH